MQQIHPWRAETGPRCPHRCGGHSVTATAHLGARLAGGTPTAWISGPQAAPLPRTSQAGAAFRGRRRPSPYWPQDVDRHQRQYARDAAGPGLIHCDGLGRTSRSRESDGGGASASRRAARHVDAKRGGVLDPLLAVAAVDACGTRGAASRSVVEGGGARDDFPRVGTPSSVHTRTELEEHYPRLLTPASSGVAIPPMYKGIPSSVCGRQIIEDRENVTVIGLNRPELWTSGAEMAVNTSDVQRGCFELGGHEPP